MVSCSGRRVICVPEWNDAAVLLLNTPPDVVVLNAITGDRWTSSRMFSWIIENQPRLQNHTVLVARSQEEAEWPDARYLVEPFRATDWEEVVHSLIDSDSSETPLHLKDSAPPISAQASA